MNKNRFFLLMLVVALFGFQSCGEKDDDDNKPKSDLKQGELTIDATAFDKWVYVSLETGAIVATEDVHAKRAGTDWDIAFHRYDVRLNGGKSGEGKAGAYLAPDKKGKSGWDAITQALPTGYIQDELIQMLTAYTMPSPTFENISASPVIKGGDQGTWVTKKGMPPTYTVTNQIFVIKTAKGKYGKLWLKQYIDANKKGGHITFKYAYQKNGSKDLK